MSAIRLKMRKVEKPWGQSRLPSAFRTIAAEGERIGEIWFEDPRGRTHELLIKYLFTSERLSIQVHPDDEAARADGHRSGKDEAWVVVDAEPDATIGVGLRHEVTKEELRAAALDGRIEELVDWRAAKAGESYYSPAGTIHALGPGLAILEVQQNVDLTYRLYDYGRPRELHLEQALAVAEAGPYHAPIRPYALGKGRHILGEGPAFVLERWGSAVSGIVDAEPDHPVWIVPLSGGGHVGGEPLDPGSAWLIEGAAEVSIDRGSDVLIAYPGKEIRSFSGLSAPKAEVKELRPRRLRVAGGRLRKTG